MASHSSIHNHVPAPSFLGYASREAPIFHNPDLQPPQDDPSYTFYVNPENLNSALEKTVRPKSSILVNYKMSKVPSAASPRHTEGDFREYNPKTQIIDPRTPNFDMKKVTGRESKFLKSDLVPMQDLFYEVQKDIAFKETRRPITPRKYQIHDFRNTTGRDKPSSEPQFLDKFYDKEWRSVDARTPGVDISKYTTRNQPNHHFLKTKPLDKFYDVRTTQQDASIHTPVIKKPKQRLTKTPADIIAKIPPYLPSHSAAEYETSNAQFREERHVVDPRECWKTPSHDFHLASGRETSTTEVVRSVDALVGKIRSFRRQLRLDDEFERSRLDANPSLYGLKSRKPATR